MMMIGMSLRGPAANNGGNEGRKPPQKRVSGSGARSAMDEMNRRAGRGPSPVPDAKSEPAKDREQKPRVPDSDDRR
jgi:hypothetical protein